MKRQFVKLAAFAALATSLVFAQASSSTPSPNPPAGRHHFVGQHRARLTQALNLTDAQKAQAKTIFQQARQTAQPLRDQLKANRQALVAAAKAGNNDAQVQQLAAQQGQLLGQMTVIRTEAFGKFYSTLTPEQRAKADQMQQNLHQRGAHFRSQRKNG
ncbi:MAG TPA: Spy/CpxP family protein refolding chaperone [Bryobacteraceae bacterium]|nr:Spy/CpxP family protein refolding chaperone [Bryobacteraceae bacterium]